MCFGVENFPVDEVLTAKSTKRWNGVELVQRLNSGIMYEYGERKFLMKTVCRYLMAHCQMKVHKI